MPKDEFDFEDPFELNGMAFLTNEDTTGDMAETFTEEFMRMGYGHKQVLALFRNPHYLGPHMVFEKRGEPFIRDLIGEVFARWGKAVTWPEYPLTPALAPPQVAKENSPPSNRESVPLEGTGGVQASNAQAQVIESEGSLTDPLGAPLPKLNV